MLGAKQTGSITTTQQKTVPPWLQTPFQGATQAATAQFGQPSPVFDPALQQYQQTLGGNYLHGGQGFNAAFDAAANRIQPQVAGAFNRAGMLNSTGAQSEMTRQLGDAFAGLYGDERNRQMQALGQARPLSSVSPLNQYISQLGDLAGPFTAESQETPLFENALAEALGLGLSGAGILSELFGEGGAFGGPSGMAAGGGDMLGGAWDWLTGGGDSGGSFADFVGGAGNPGVGLGMDDSGSMSLPPTPPGGAQSFFDFAGGDPGATGGNMAGFTPSGGFQAFTGGAFPTGAYGALSGLGGLGTGFGLGATGVGSTAAALGAPASFGAFAPGLFGGGAAVAAPAAAAPGLGGLAGLSSLALPALFAAPILGGIMGAISGSPNQAAHDMQESSWQHLSSTPPTTIPQGHPGAGQMGVPIQTSDGQVAYVDPYAQNNPYAGEGYQVVGGTDQYVMINNDGTMTLQQGTHLGNMGAAQLAKEAGVAELAATDPQVAAALASQGTAAADATPSTMITLQDEFGSSPYQVSLDDYLWSIQSSDMGN